MEVLLLEVLLFLCFCMLKLKGKIIYICTVLEMQIIFKNSF